MNNNRNVSTFSPFITFCQHVIPLAYDESMSYYETLCALRDYLVNTVIPAVNNNADAVTELQESYTNFIATINDKVKELEAYIDNYFKNLDVQTEINNKLDEMAQSGELTEIIGQYLKLNSVLAFNTRSDLKNTNNLNNGSFTYCFGKDTYNDGYGAFYKIRESINTDVANDEDLIALTNYPNLIAEKMPNNNFTENFNLINNSIDKINSDIENIQNELNKQDITLIIGDSFTTEDNEGENLRGGAHSWVERFRENSKNDVINTSMNGTGFYHTDSVGDMTFDEQYMSIINNEEYDNNLIDTIIIYGGLNDIRNETYGNTSQGAINLANHIKQYTPKAKVYFIFFNQNNVAQSENDTKWTNDLFKDLSQFNFNFVRGAGFLRGSNNDCFMSDNVHPNEKGCNRIATCIINIVNGITSYSISVNVSNLKVTSPIQMAITGATFENNLKYYPITGDLKGSITIHVPSGYTASHSTESQPSKGLLTFTIDSDFGNSLSNEFYNPQSTVGVGASPNGTCTGFSLINMASNITTLSINMFVLFQDITWQTLATTYNLNLT